MNWLELDKVRSGHTTRLRRKPPDPTIGDHLPPPTRRPANVNSSVSLTVDQSTVNQPASSSPPKEHLPHTVRVEEDSTQQQSHHPLHYSSQQMGVSHYYQPSQRVSFAGVPFIPMVGSQPTYGVRSQYGYSQPSLNSFNGNGRMSNVINDMMSLPSGHQTRVLTLKGAAAEASSAQGDSLDLLLLEFAGITASRNAPAASVAVGHGRAPPPYPPPPYSQPPYPVAPVVGHSLPSSPHRYPQNGAHYNYGGRSDLVGTMVHTTEVVTNPIAPYRYPRHEVDRYGLSVVPTPTHSSLGGPQPMINGVRRSLSHSASQGISDASM